MIARRTPKDFPRKDDGFAEHWVGEAGRDYSLKCLVAIGHCFFSPFKHFLKRNRQGSNISCGSRPHYNRTLTIATASSRMRILLWTDAFK